MISFIASLFSKSLMKYLLPVGVIAGIAGYGYYYVQNKNGQIERLKNEVVEVSIENRKLEDDVAVLENLNTRQQEIQQDFSTLNSQLQKREDELNELRNTLFNHNLTRLSYEKPGLIERRINNASNKVFDDLGDIVNGSSK